MLKRDNNSIHLGLKKINRTSHRDLNADSHTGGAL